MFNQIQNKNHIKSTKTCKYKKKLNQVLTKNDEYEEEKDTNIVREDIEGTMNPMLANYLGAGKSKRIYQELYKVR